MTKDDKLARYQRMLDAGDIDQHEYETLVAKYRASVEGAGAIAQGGGDALGQGSVKVEGANSGDINTGTQVLGNVETFVALQHITQTGEDPKIAQSVIVHYLSALATDLAGLKLGEIDGAINQAQQKPLELADIYVPLDTTLNIPKKISLAQWRTQNFKYYGIETKGETRVISALDALAAHRKLTLLGNAGGGKSTFGASVLLNLAQAWQGHDDKLKALGEHWEFGKLLPIRVILRRFAEQYGEGQPTAGDIWTFIEQDLKSSGYGMSSDTLKYIQQIVLKRGALILFDGLDECGDSQRRARVEKAVQEFIQHNQQKCRFLLTARPYAFPKGAAPEQGIYMLADFNDAQIEQFIRAWYAALVKRGWSSPGDAERKMVDLLAVRQRHDLKELAKNPLLLTLMVIVNANQKIPDDRVDLYDESVELLLLRWNRQIGADKALLDELSMPDLKLSALRGVLEKLAFTIHEENVGREAVADVGEDKLVRAFCPLLGNSKDKASIVVEYIEKRAGLLVGQGEKDGERQFAFPHRTFQEFLAACYLSKQVNFSARCNALARKAMGHWQVALTLAARVAEVERGSNAANALIHGESVAEYRLSHTPNPTDWACAQLAGNQLLEIGLSEIRMEEHTRAIAKRVADWLVAGLALHPDQGGAPAIQRAQMGDVLSQLGDPRFDPQRLYLPNDEMLGFEFIPEDKEFRIGTRKVGAHDDEINDQLTPAPACYLARYPVTVAQFRAFVEANQDFKLGDKRALHDPDNHPVRYVNWHEARAYCDWLNPQLLNEPATNPIAKLVREGWRVSLPSELEWEHAARGGQPNQEFPWGDQPDPNRANYHDTGIANTSSVGCFPPNDDELYDMVGNVWEWTRSHFKDYPYKAEDGREHLNAGDDVRRVVRGGSWNNLHDGARCAVRSWIRPSNRYDYIGFRVVLRFSPVNSELR
ncbi:MAG: SUMF1/EgtB/PvdO family nonheme iron enzyme [Gallionella sp.]|nr:SUMF1/EgtB/PvdO family nonheme iron enzyme [Gallionella sp.]MDD4957976.1 SUMF1/EgtB/PvdO family nonheme iron enzyme [Gallionella sp.]